MAKTNPEAPMIKQGKWKYTWHMMKTNKACYAMLLPFINCRTDQDLQAYE